MATSTITVSPLVVKALNVYTNDGDAAAMKAALEVLIEKWAINYLQGYLAQRKAALEAAIDVDEDKLAAAESAVGL